jgi:autotransporter-associated beta strand protein
MKLNTKKYSNILRLLQLGTIPLAATQSLRADSAVWNGASGNDTFWSTLTNWVGPPVAVPGSTQTATFNNVGASNAFVDTTGGVTIKSIIFDHASAPSYTIEGSGPISLQTGGDITMSSTTGNDQLITAPIAFNATGNFIASNASATKIITVQGNVVAGAGVDGTLIKTGAGKFVFSGTNNWCQNVDNRNGKFVVTGGGELSLQGGQNIFAQTANTGRTARLRCLIGGDGTTAAPYSGGNILRLSSGGRMVVSGTTIGGGTYTALNTNGNNKLIASNPGTSGNKTVQTTGQQGADIYDSGASVIGENSNGNGLEVSNGAYVDAPAGSKSWYIGSNNGGSINGSGDYVGQGAENNYISITGTNSILARTSNNMTYVGHRGNGNYIDISSGGRYNAVRIAVGTNGDNNYIKVNGTNSVLNGGGQDVLTVGGGNGTGTATVGATPSGNYIQIENGASMTFTGNQNRDNNIGNATLATSNYIKATGVGSSVSIRESQPLVIGSYWNSGAPPDVATNTGNYLQVSDGATGFVNCIQVYGLANKVKVGSGTANIASLEVRSQNSLTTTLNGIYLKNSGARLEMNKGRLTAGQNTSTPQEMVSGAGQVDMISDGYFSSAYAGSIVASEVTGAGKLTKEGTGTISFTNTATSTFTGNTVVNDGTLSVSSPTFFDDNANVTIGEVGASPAKLRLTTGGATDIVKKLFIDGVQMPAGTYGSTSSAATNTDDATFDNLGDGILQVTSGPGSNAYDTWSSTNSLANPAFDFDSDKDGLANGIEWVLGGNPNANDNPSVLPTVSGTAAGGLTLVFNRNSASITETTLVVEWGSVLSGFANTLTIGTTDVGPSGNNPTIDIDAPSVGKVTVNIPAANAVGGKILARLKATRLP